MRIAYWRGYRVYFAKQGTTIYLLFTGGDKSTQKKRCCATGKVSQIAYWIHAFGYHQTSESCIEKKYQWADSRADAARSQGFPETSDKRSF
jgi:hypothetical protein